MHLAGCERGQFGSSCAYQTRWYHGPDQKQVAVIVTVVLPMTRWRVVVLSSQIVKIAELTPARSTDTTENFRWNGRDTTRSAGQDQAKTGAFHHERIATDLGPNQPSLGNHRQMPARAFIN
jgi:hypothetical protein